MVFLTALLSIPAFCQQNKPVKSAVPEPEAKRIFWIIPNFRTSPSLPEYKPLTRREKFRTATLDSFDRGTVALGVLFAGEAQLMDSNPSFGQGVRGYARYFGTSYADYVIGDYMTEAIFPALLHQDPRYFRHGTGSGLSRLGYAAGQIFWTHNDSGRGQFNFSEIAGNSTAVAISMAYYPENRDVTDGVSRLCQSAWCRHGLEYPQGILSMSPHLYLKITRESREPQMAPLNIGIIGGGIGGVAAAVARAFRQRSTRELLNCAKRARA